MRLHPPCSAADSWSCDTRDISGKNKSYNEQMVKKHTVAVVKILLFKVYSAISHIICCRISCRRITFESLLSLC